MILETQIQRKKKFFLTVSLILYKRYESKMLMRLTISPIKSRIAATETRAKSIGVHLTSIELTCKNEGRDFLAFFPVAEHPQVDDGPVDDQNRQCVYQQAYGANTLGPWKQRCNIWTTVKAKRSNLLLNPNKKTSRPEGASSRRRKSLNYGMQMWLECFRGWMSDDRNGNLIFHENSVQRRKTFVILTVASAHVWRKAVCSKPTALFIQFCFISLFP